MSQKYRKVAIRYAKALYAVIATGGGEVQANAQQTARELAELGRVWQSQKELSQLVLNPMFSKEDRKKALLQVARLGTVSPVLERFLGVVFDRDRIAALPEIAEAFKKTADEASGIVQIEVITASAIEAGERTEIERKLSSKIRGNAEFIRSTEFTWSTDATIIGGLVVKFGGKVLDGSLSGRLQGIERELLS